MKTSTAVRATVAAATVIAAAPALATHAAVPGLDQSCSTNKNMANVRVATKSGHAVSGSWSLDPVFTCQDAEMGLTVAAELDHDGHPFLVSDGSCNSTIPACTSAVGASKHARLGASIRGRYVLRVTVTITGVDAALSQGCDYSATTLTATCTATSTPVVIR
jgi:hypothetical protein